MLALYNTLGRKKMPFRSLINGEVSFYTCGPTVYNYAHIGNLRAYLSADTLRRWLIHGHEYMVKWVLNITDVDDKTIRDSQKKYPKNNSKQALKDFTREYEDIFFNDLALLNVKKSDFFANPRATDFIPQMQELIRKIYTRGYAKIIDGSIFFDVKKWSQDDSYGKLLPLDLSQLKSGTRTLSDEIEKEDVADFALWKGAKSGEPYWDFEFDGKNIPGRPGWHLECSAMEKEIFGVPFDIHSGGVDLIFPHHEDEIAQSACGYSCEPTGYWIHNEHLLVDGKKMSKSLGNFYTLHDLLKKNHSAESIRFFLVLNHYRSKLNLTEEGIFSAENVIKKFRNFLRLSVCGEGVEACLRNDVASLIEKAKDDFSSAMNDDLNTPVAIAAVHNLTSQIQPFFPLCQKESQLLADFFVYVGEILGVSFFPKELEIPQHVKDLAEKRERARKEKHWKESDELRDTILNYGFEVRDVSNGYEIVSKEA